MKHQEVFTTNGDLEAVRERFETWRKTRVRGSRIPQTLWDAAVELAESHSVNEVSRVLRLEYNHLKRRIAEKRSADQDSGCRFIELDPSPKQATSECAIEMQRPDGAQMRVQIKGARGSELFDLAKAFWSGA